MAKAVLISIRPKWCEKIVGGEKTIEVRKTRPKLETPFKCYIYCTRAKHEYEDYFVVECDDHCCVSKDFFGGGHVVCEFLCDTILPIQVECSSPAALGAGIEVPSTCLTDREILEYLGNGNQGFAWHISDMKIYGTPKKLSEFKGLRKTKFGYAPVDIKRPPQSWCYVEELA